jgi:hypothetical protein
MRHRQRSFLAWSATALLSLAPGAASAQDQAASAEALFREGRALMAQGKQAEACPKFAVSQRLEPGYGTLWNLADCYAQIGRTASSWAAFREAADLAKKADQADRVAKAERRAASLEPKLERMIVTVKAPAAGLTVKRSGVPLEPPTWGTSLPIDPGKHLVEASAPGKMPFSVEVQTAGPGKTVSVEIPLLVDAPSAPPAPSVGQPFTAQPLPPQPQPRDSGAETRRTLAYVAGGVGLAGVVVGSITGVIASSKWSKAQDEHCRTETLCDAEGVALTGEAKTAASISTASFIVGGVALGAGVALFVTSLGGSKPTAARVVIAPSAGPSGGGVDVRVRF